MTTSALASDADVFATKTFDFVDAPKRDFRPWHKPRKQAIRAQQWGAEIQWLLDSRTDLTRDLRYIGLPGSDLLDIRDVLTRFNLPKSSFRFLGFDRSAKETAADSTWLNVSLSEVRAHPAVDPQSDVVGDEFSLIADPTSLAHSAAHTHGTYDVVNIDLCGHLGNEAPGAQASLFAAIQTLMGTQQRHRREWVLLLTTRVNADVFDPVVYGKLAGKISENLRASSLFSRTLDDELPTVLSIAEAFSMTRNEEIDRKFLNTVIVGVSKWLLGFSHRSRSVFSVSTPRLYRVRHDASVPDMASLAFRFTPKSTIGPDPAGLGLMSDDLAAEIAQAIEIPPRVAAAQDLDAVLRDDPELLDELTQESANLLQSARYGRTEYLDWVADLREKERAVLADEGVPNRPLAAD